MIEKISHEDLLLAIIIRKDYKGESIQFFSPAEFPQQLGYMNRPQGYSIKPHVHNPVERTVIYTQEVLVIRTGKVRVDFYDDSRNYLKSLVVHQGDVILLANGGHGFEMLEDSEIIEVKQGPYCGEKDKTRFDPVDNSMIKFI
jgi:hypothetical protein